MKKLFVFALSCALVLGMGFGLTSCGDGDEKDYDVYYLSGTIEGLPVNSYFDLVVLERKGNTELDIVAIRSDGYGRAPFSIVLPSYMPYGALYHHLDFPSFRYAIDPIANLSAPEMRVTDARLEIYDGAGYLGYVWYDALEDNLPADIYDVRGHLLYSDSYAVADGYLKEGGKETDYDFRLRQGWNWLYEVKDIVTNISDYYGMLSERPAGVAFHFYTGNPPAKKSAGTRSATAR